MNRVALSIKNTTFRFLRALWALPPFFRVLRLLLPRKNWGNFVQISEVAGFKNAFSISWGQGGEDLALLHAIAG